MLLLTIIYIAFIGLGLPDSLIGAAWPAIYQNLNLPFSSGSFITAIIYCGTMLSSMFSAQFIRRFGTWGITAFSTALTAAALFGFSLSNHYIFLCLFAVPLGLGAGSIDTALNNYVSLHAAASFLMIHTVYYMECDYRKCSEAGLLTTEVTSVRRQEHQQEKIPIASRTSMIPMTSPPIGWKMMIMMMTKKH